MGERPTPQKSPQAPLKRKPCPICKENPVPSSTAQIGSVRFRTCAAPFVLLCGGSLSGSVAVCALPSLPVPTAYAHTCRYPCLHMDDLPASPLAQVLVLSTWAACAHGQVVFYHNTLRKGLRVGGVRAAVTMRGSLGSSREADTPRQGVGQRFYSGTGHCCCFLSRPRDMEKAAHAFGQMPDGLLGQFSLGRAWFPSEGVKMKWYQREPH